MAWLDPRGASRSSSTPRPRDVDPFFGGIFTPQRRAQSLGSGLIIEPNGMVRAMDRGSLLLAVQRGPFVYNLEFAL